MTEQVGLEVSQSQSGEFSNQICRGDIQVNIVGNRNGGAISIVVAGPWPSVNPDDGFSDVMHLPDLDTFRAIMACMQDFEMNLQLGEKK